MSRLGARGQAWTDAVRMPASYGQEETFLAADGESSGQNLAVAWDLDGPLQRDALELALDALVQRHESLRTSFELRSGVVEQLIWPAVERTLKIADLSDAPEVEAALTTTTADVVTEPFRITRAPLWRGLLARTGHERHVLVLAVNHAVTDGWSGGVASRDLLRLYRAAVAGSAVALPELRVQYGDYAAWERKRGVASRWERYALARTREVRLPVRAGWRPDAPYDGARFEVGPLPADQAKVLETVATENGSSLGHALRAAVLVSLWSHLNDTEVLGATCANRDRAELVGLIAPLAEQRPLLLDLRGVLSFGELIRRIDAAWRDAQGDVAMAGYLSRQLRLRREAGTHLFDVAVNYMSPFAAGESLRNGTVDGALRVQPRYVGTTGLRLRANDYPGISQLNFAFRRTMTGAVQGELWANAAAFEVDTVRAAVSAFELTVRRIAQNGERASDLAAQGLAIL